MSFRQAMESVLALLLVLSSPQAADTVPPLEAARAKVEAIRGLEFRRDVVREPRTRAELRKMLLDELAGEAGGAEGYRLLLEAALLVEPDDELIERMLDAYEQQVLAWYDPKTGRFYELTDPAADVASIPMMRDGVLVHELTHALQDQWFSIGDRLDALEHDWDRAQAYHAVLEGEASLVMLESGLNAMGSSLSAVRKSGLSVDQMIETMRAAAAGTFPADVDPWFVESMKFPYIEGLKFVMYEWSRGGWSAVQEIHANPPISTEEVFHPELWRARIDSGAAGGAPLRAEGKESTSFTLGEFAWRHLLDEDAAAGIDRGIVTVSEAGAGHTVEIDSRWDSERDAEEFESAWRALARRRGIDASVSRRGLDVVAKYVWPPASEQGRTAGGESD